MSNSKVYFGFAIADSMFPASCSISKFPISVDLVRSRAELVPCLNPSHAATIAAMKNRFGLDVPIPEKPPQVQLSSGDRVIVMSVRGLPRLTDRHEYTEAEIESAQFSFSEYVIS